MACARAMEMGVVHFTEDVHVIAHNSPDPIWVKLVSRERDVELGLWMGGSREATWGIEWG